MVQEPTDDDNRFAVVIQQNTGSPLNPRQPEKARPRMPFPRVLSRIHADYINKVALHFVGSTALADLEHVGRKSGLVRHTPLRAFRTQDKVVIALNFGRESEWLKNIQATDRCRMRLGDQILELSSPRIVPVKQGSKGMPWVFGVALRYVVHTADCVELSVISSAPAETSA